MQTYSGHRPTRFDGHIELEGREEWLIVPCSRTRDSNCLEESNFATAYAMLGHEGENVEIHRFGHWGPGWYELILVRPNTEEAKKAEAIEAALANYPVLSDDDLAQREQEAADLTWKQCYSVSERIAYIKTHRSQFEFRSFADMLGCVRGNYFAGYASELLG